MSDDRNDIQKVYDSIFFEKRKRVVGWGTGSLYEYYSRLMPVRLDYLIDNNPSRWGRVIDGSEVRGPDALLGEDPEETIVLIYSSFVDQISEQLKSYGEYMHAPISVLSGYEEVRFLQEKMDRQMVEKKVERGARTKRAVMIQGPLTSEWNLKVVEYYSKLYPEDGVILSTWDATNPRYLERVEKLVDVCLVNTPPAFSGFQNRNYQIVSTREGIKKAKEMGMETVLKVRTDVALLGRDLLDSFGYMYGMYNDKAPEKYGLKGRIIVPETYTRKYMMYHPSDLVMYGHVEDMLKYWDAAFDFRKFSPNGDEAKTQTAYELSCNLMPAETYFASEFCKKVGWEQKKTVEDSWEFYRDLFIVVDNNWLDLFWPKYPRFYSAQIRNVVHNCVNHYFWQKLYFGKREEISRYKEVDIVRTRWIEAPKEEVKKD